MLQKLNYHQLVSQRELETSVFKDIYQLPAYHLIETTRYQGIPFRWDYQDEYFSFFIPLIHSKKDEYRYPGNLLSPYGYPGIVLTSVQSYNWLPAFLQYHRQVIAAGFKYSFLRFHPLYNFVKLPSFPGFIFRNCGETISIDLSISHDLIFDSFSTNHKRNLLKVDKVSFTCLQSHTTEFLFHFSKAYNETMKRRNAEPKYFLNQDYFAALLKDLNPFIWLIIVVDEKGNFASGGIFSFYKEIGQYLYGATKYEYLPLSPAKLVIKQAIILGKQLGCKWLHLGGGYGASTSDGLFRFKQGFSSVKWQYYTLEIFHHQFEKYLESYPIKI